MFIMFPRVFASNLKLRFELFCLNFGFYMLCGNLWMGQKCQKFMFFGPKIQNITWKINSSISFEDTDPTNISVEFQTLLIYGFNWIGLESQNFEYIEISFLVYFLFLGNLATDIYRFKGSEYGFMVRAYVFTLI